MRVLPIGLMVLGLMGIAVAGVTSPATPVNKVVIGVLNFETGGGKKDLMRELRRNTRVKLVDIRESCSLSDLKRRGYERAEGYKNIYQLDMILHTYRRSSWGGGGTKYFFYFGLMDLYTKRVKEVSVETPPGISIDLALRGISRKILVSQDLNRVLSAKKKVVAKKEVAVPPEVKKSPKEEVGESPQEIEDFLIQKGPKLISEDEYDRVLELIDDLPKKRSRHVQIQTLECFANLKGWVSDRDQSCKSRWWNVRQRLINSGDNEARHVQIQTLECFANLKGWVSDRDQSCKSRWWNVRERLINLGDNEATPMLLIFLKDEDPWMRIYAAELLGHIGDKRALKDLRAAGENDENRKVRKYAKKAYEQIFGEKF
jgi:hypothetical protein